MKVRSINVSEITSAVKDLCIKSNLKLPKDIRDALNENVSRETFSDARDILRLLIENYKFAEEKNIPICQDTGMAIIFVEIGQEIHLEGGPLVDAINLGVRLGYTEGYLRCSVVDDPLFSRINTQYNTPAIIYTNIVMGDKLKITVCPKGFGSENMSRIKMFTPGNSEEDIVNFVVETVMLAGSKACPPLILGIGIGGDFEYAAYLSKKALCRDLSLRNTNPKYAELEAKILRTVNETNIGPQGFGGKTTALGVNIEYYPTHIASLPVAINMGCHAIRHASTEL